MDQSKNLKGSRSKLATLFKYEPLYILEPERFSANDFDLVTGKVRYGGVSSSKLDSLIFNDKSPFFGVVTFLHNFHIL